MVKGTSDSTAFLSLALTVIIIISVASFVTAWVPQQQGAVNTTEQAASYIIFKDGDFTCAKNGSTSRIDYKSLNASATILYAVNNAGTTNLINSIPGSTIVIKPGIYSLRENLTIIYRGNLHISGYGAILKVENGTNANALRLDCSASITIDGLTLSGAPGDTVGCGVEIKSCVDITLNNMNIRGFPQDGVKTTMYSWWGTTYLFSKCYISDCDVGVNVTSASVGDYSIDDTIVENCRDGIIMGANAGIVRNMWLENIDEEGITVHAAGVCIYGGLIDSTTTGVWVNWTGSGYQPKRTLIEGVYFLDDVTTTFQLDATTWNATIIACKIYSIIDLAHGTVYVGCTEGENP